MSVQVPSTDSRRNQYFIPGDGIARQVITADICKYLDNDALVRPGDYQGITGFFIFAYRNLTKEMIEDLKADSRKFDQEKRKFSGGQQGSRHQDLTYVNSRTHAASHASDPSYGNSRTHPPSSHSHGGSSPHFSHPTHAHAPPPSSRGAPPVDFGRQQPSPYHDSQYPTQPLSDDYPSTSRAGGYSASGFPAAASGPPPSRSSFTAPYPSSGYAGSDDSVMTTNTYSSGGYGSQPPPHAPQIPQSRDYPMGSASTAPVQSNRGGMNTYPDSRNDTRGAPPPPRSGYGEKRPADSNSYADSPRHYSDSRRRH